MSKFMSDNPFEPWNGPERDNPGAPWNGPERDNPFACWNNPFGKGLYESDCKKYRGR